MAQHTELVLVLAADSIQFGNIFGGYAHMVAIEDLIECIEDHQVGDLTNT